ncbi:MAG: branched-chain amino acid ABC transporter permease [Planctomycetes bacterium]|nr:branched-chain amino acid ABC transporter permease [Planctomycetota bacterium]
MPPLLAVVDPAGLTAFAQQVLNGLTTGSLFALIAIGYTMVYGILELINFAHGDLFMLSGFLALTLVGWLGLAATGSTLGLALGLALVFLLAMTFAAALNYAVDRLVYKPLRHAPKLTPLVSAIGVSFVFMGLGQLWKGVADINFPDLLSNRNLLDSDALRFTLKDLVVICVTIPLMLALTVFVKFTKLGKAMRATAQNPMAARLMGIDVDRVIGATFLIGGSLAGAASVIYGLSINTVSFQMGYQNGLYAFTAAVLGGIGNLPGAMLGGLIIGLVRSLGSQYVGEQWTSALVFAILIVLLVFRPSGLLGTRTREKV